MFTFVSKCYLLNLNSSEDYTFEMLFSTHSKKVFNIALNMLQRIEDAEDVTQEVFIEVHKALHTFNGQSQISTWLYRIAVNKSLDFLKAKKRKKRFAFITHLFHPETGEQLYESKTFTHPGIALEQKEHAKYLYQAIDTLNENQKTAFVLSQIEHLPQKEIAQIMNLNEKAIESLIQRAKANLRIRLGDIYQQRRK